MKRKWLWFIIFCFGFLFIGTSCSTNAYDGEMCGKATAGGTNEFSLIRNYYVAEYIAEKNKVDTEKKYEVKDGEVQVANSYGTYLFVINYEYQEKDGNNNPSTIVKAYVEKNFKQEEVESTLESINKLSNSYNVHIHDVSMDSVKDDVVANVATRLRGHSKACIVFGESIQDPQTGVMIHPKTWGQAFKVGGFLTGLIVYPVSWLLHVFVNLFGGSGTAQVFAIIVVTFILKILIMLMTFKSTLSTHKMNDVQPEIAELQRKYGTNPTPEQRNRMSMEMMAIYKKYDIKPFAPFVSMLVTFPVFIAMYRAVIQTTVLRTGKFLGVILGETISANITGSFKVGALVIFLIMAITQVVSMKLPQLLNKNRISEEAKKMQKSTSMMTYIFLFMILIMGFTMPATMSIYWIASSIVSAAQTLIMHSVNGVKGSKGKKYKVKKVEKKYTIPQGKIIDK